MAIGTANSKGKILNLVEVEFTENGLYIPSKNVTGFIKVKVNVDTSPVLNEDKTIDEDGIYTADTGYTGLGTVTVTAGSVTAEFIETQLHQINSGVSEV